jgi:hypothetical protein
MIYCYCLYTTEQGAALENVLAFDAADPRLRAQLAAVFSSQGIPLPTNFATSVPGQVNLHELELVGQIEINTLQSHIADTSEVHTYVCSSMLERDLPAAVYWCTSFQL